MMIKRAYTLFNTHYISNILFEALSLSVLCSLFSPVLAIIKSPNMGTVEEIAEAMDPVQKRLMFDDE